MKLRLLSASLLLFSACASPEEQSPPDEVGQFPPDYVVSSEVGVEVSSPEVAVGEASSGENLEIDVASELLSCREKNTEVSLEIEAMTRKLASCQEELDKKPQTISPKSIIPTLKESHAILLRNALLETPQKEFAFDSCGRLGTFLGSSWFTDFSTQLSDAKIRFSNGFLETEDFFGGCQSDTGRMAFFLGAEREDDYRFIVIKYDIANKSLEPALLLNGAEDAVVTEFGKREGSFINFPADDGRTLRYYYDSNIVIQSPS
ncbi:hypothetical protein IPN35_06285 [Candidatus Peregrinibacteria bacterium]|nr:MAG: hypothetical protein IPN35_06285 [Candidatus Peregrinibacteria bacterium]